MNFITMRLRQAFAFCPGRARRAGSLQSLMAVALLFMAGVPAWAALDPGKPPGDNFDLSHWYLTLPDSSASRISADDLEDGYTHSTWFYTGSDGAMVFWVPVTGGTTSNSQYPRSELRGLIEPDDTDVNWRGYGTHILNAQCQVRQVPSSGKVIIGQIHTFTGAARPLVKIQFNNGTVEGLVKETPSSSNDVAFLFPNIPLNTLINYQVKMMDGVVSITVNGATRSTNVFLMNRDWEPQEFYFKAGAYCIDNSGPSSEGAGVAFYHLTATHSSSSQPSITTQPADQTVAAGETARFSVTATGTAPLRYQWRKDEIDLAGATNAALSITNVQATHAGNYRVVASNSAGSETSLVSRLTVLTSAGGGGDITAPAAITDLRVSAASAGSATLVWTAPGDDGSTGTAARYDLRYSTALINEANWAVANQASGEPAPSAAGTLQTTTIHGLGSGVTYYFALKTLDETNNISPLSNRATATTLQAPSSNVVLVASNSVWKYLDNGSDQGAAWRARDFDDSRWAFGPAPLGYGNGREATVVGYGNNADNKYLTTYFRHAFHVSDAGTLTNVSLRVLRDDGAVVYLNGVEVFRSNIPTGPVTWLTRAESSVSSPEDVTFFATNVSPAHFVAGLNVLAVEIHQRSATSSDIAFNLELTARDLCPLNEGNSNAIGLAVERQGTNLVLRWPVRCATHVLEQTANVLGQMQWQPVAAGVSVTNGCCTASIPLDQVNRLYRLRKQ